MKDLEQSLGKAISVKQLAEYLGVNEKTIRENYRQFGGIKIGRHYRFFTKEVMKYGLQEREKMGGPSSQGQFATGKGSPDTERSKKVGSRDAKAERRRMEREDKHNLFD